MKICYISHGAFTHIRPYLDFFRSAGHNVSLITLAPGGDYDVTTYDLSIGTNFDSALAKFKYVLSSLKARKLLKKIKPDIVHTHYVTSGGLAGLICNFNPTVTTAHGSDLACGKDSIIWRPLLKMIFKQAYSVNVVSGDLKKMAMGLGVPEDKVEALTLGIDTQKFSFMKKEPYDGKRPLRLVNTRRLEPVYDHPTIIKALSIIKSKGQLFEMTFVGYGVLQDDLEKMAQELNVQDCVKFLGGCDNSQMPVCLAENDVYLSSSLRDGTSLCLLEAMAVGTFPIVSHIPANSAWIEDGQTGLLHKVGNEEELAEKILRFVEQPEMAANAVTANREMVEQDGDRLTNMKKLEDIYIKLIAN